MIQCIIVEDDPKCSKRLAKLLNEVTEEVEVLLVATRVEEALAAIDKFDPELIFLDIELGNERGFSVLKSVRKINFDVIFTTSHIDNNISEIRACSISYLPKPVILAELEDALRKFQEKYKSKFGRDQIQTLSANLQMERIEDRVIWIHDTKSNYYPVEVKNIVYCTSNNQYTTFVIRNEKKEILTWVSTKGIGEWELDLEQYKFCRIHNRCLINLKHVTRYTKGEGGIVQMNTGESFEVAKDRKSRFLRLSGMR